ncbi:MULTISPECIES: PUA domain-containing protein [Halomicrobium]|uniref:PUA domain containing protein n=2 Tax=Halomicrobium mukohataei TaxID=57705 RepID=C7P2H2_HALMD|nr:MULTISPECIES: PUA domain-containing protein [Halomicrobium]ACV49287.1 PUA domain containing protein [Halomicrobium mukohataei DSM 12286]QCD64686.1 pseudouridine synthase [Halomicrobium mukohataei]QFR19493.1 pseudouridine synthase [Halomicrobium sp. ZPS1]
MSERATDLLTRVATYQFGPGADEALFPDVDGLDVTTTRSGRPRQVRDGDDRLLEYGSDGRFTLGVAGGRRLLDGLDDARHQVVVGDDSEPFVREGRNAFAKFVRSADEGIRPGDEVLVVHYDGDLLGVGRAELPGEAMLDFETGMAVKVRHGAGTADASES